MLLIIDHRAEVREPYTNGMDFHDVVRKRRMVRHFTAQPVPDETVARIVEAAQHAPSAGFSQGVSFVAVTEQATRQRVAQIAGEDLYVADGMHPFISEAPVQIIICTSEQVYKERYREPDKKPDPEAEELEWPVPYWHTDAGCALMLILLAAVNEGLAGAFVGVWDQRGLQQLLGIPEHFLPIGVTMIGYGAEDVKSKSLKRGRRTLDTVLHRERWSDAD
ncbi:MAG: nitroreductase family protein [Chloroflexota bacterium]|nr:nitroreductase family protein [Chloroflexota bacterium]